MTEEEIRDRHITLKIAETVTWKSMYHCTPVISMCVCMLPYKEWGNFDPLGYHWLTKRAQYQEWVTAYGLLAGEIL